ncbi:hypothetical protein [Pseudomonas sp.]|uniref:hypothetical protein n=2 Tax=Pseudomonas sp. TaxID=306 RepID=UPI003982B8B0
MNCHIDLSTGEITTPELAQPLGQLLSNAVGTSTRLDGTISDISWNDGLFLGKGIDAMTGDVRGSAIDSFTTEQHGTQKIEQSTRYLMSSEDVEKEIEASVSLKFNLGNFSADTTNSYLEKLAVSHTTVSIIAEYSVTQSEFDIAPSYQLTTQARKLLDNPADFRQAYGDYFVAGFKRSARFTAIYRCQASSMEKMKSFKSSLKAGYGDLFSAEGSAGLKSLAKEQGISLSMDVSMFGVTSTPPQELTLSSGKDNGDAGFAQVQKLLEWFKSNQKGTPFQALLWHYSTLQECPTYSSSIDVDPQAFVEIKAIRRKLWHAKITMEALPAGYQQAIKHSLSSLEDLIKAHQDDLIGNAQRRRDYDEQLEVLQQKINEITERQAFYLEVKDRLASEPPQSQLIAEKQDGQHEWLYGLDSYPASQAVRILSEQHDCQEKYAFAKHKTSTLRFTSSGRLIVGWKVSANWHDGTDGWWCKASDGILLRPFGEVAVKSQLTRGFNWSVTYYYVDAKDYQF